MLRVGRPWHALVALGHPWTKRVAMYEILAHSILQSARSRPGVSAPIQPDAPVCRNCHLVSERCTKGQLRPASPSRRGVLAQCLGCRKMLTEHGRPDRFLRFAGATRRRWCGTCNRCCTCGHAAILPPLEFQLSIDVHSQCDSGESPDNRLRWSQVRA